MKRLEGTTLLMSSSSSSPILIPDIPIGSVEGKRKVVFEVVTAKVVETAGKKHVVSI